MTARPPVRTLLFVPANRPERMAKALTLPSDAVVFDLESAIPGAVVAEARTMVATALADRGGDRPRVFVRVNSEPARLADDLDAVVGPALDGVLLPQVVGPDDVRRVDDLLAAREADRGLAVGHTAVMPLVETAAAVRLAYEIATASPRVAYMGGATSRGGDLARSIGYRWTAAGDETAYLRSKVLIDVRAAGVPNPLSGLWGVIDDLDGLADFAARTRGLGYEGMMVIHPSHLAIVNAAFTPTPDEIAGWRRIVAAMAEAEDAGSGAIRLDGRLIDVAHVHTARRELARAPNAWERSDMAMPTDVGIVDLMFTTPIDRRAWHRSFGNLVKDDDSLTHGHAAGYLFTDLPEVDGTVDFVAYLIAEMDRWGIDKGLLPVAFGDEWGTRGVAEHPDRLYGVFLVDPNQGMRGVADLRRAVDELGAVAAACFPAGYLPQVSISDPLMYPFYAACVELDVPMCINAGVPGPRFPMDAQHVGHLDQVCYDFADLVLVTRHGAEPWEDLMVKLMLKWPNLHYSTSAFAPKHYPRAIVDYANTRGADKVLYAGYFPSGLSLERIMTELPGVPFRDHVWPKFLRQNALRLFCMAD